MIYLGYFIIFLGVICSAAFSNIMPTFYLTEAALISTGFWIIWHYKISKYPQGVAQCEYCWRGAKIGGMGLLGVIIFSILFSTHEFSNIWKFLFVVLFLLLTIISVSLIFRYLNCLQFYKKLGRPWL